MRLPKLAHAVTLLIIFFATPSQALNLTEGSPVETLIANLQQQSFLQGSYTQKRTLKGFSKALSSSGQFKFWRNHGLYWQTDKPFFSALTYNDKDILYWSATGELTSQQAPSVTERHINKILLAIFSADIKELEKLFNLKINHADDNSWNIELTPSNPIVSQALVKVTLNGARYLEQANIFSTNGNENTIIFSNIEHTEKPGKEQCKLFFNPAQQSCS